MAQGTSTPSAASQRPTQGAATQPEPAGEKPRDAVIACVVYSRLTDTVPQVRSPKWSQLAQLLTRHDVRLDKDGRLWSPTTYKPGTTRGDKNVLTVTAAIGDFDKTIEWMALRPKLDQWDYVVHSTHRHSVDEPRFRVVIPFTQPVAAEDWDEVWRRIRAHVFGGFSDVATSDPSRAFYMPSHPPGASHFGFHHKGRWLDPTTLPPVAPDVSADATTTGNTEPGQPKVQLGKAALDFVANGAPMGEQRSRALKAARNYLSAGYSVEDTAEAIWRGLQASPRDPERDPWSRKDALAIASDLADKDAPPLETEHPLPPRCEMRRVGLGYVLNFPVSGVTVTADHVRRSGDKLSALLRVESSIPLAPRCLYWGNVPMSTATARKAMENNILDKLKATGSDGGINWGLLIDDVCWRIALMERAGEPFQTVGKLPQTEQITWLIRNFAPRNESMTVFGEGGSGKSYLALALALSVFTGKTFVPGFTPLDSGPVLYLDWEAGPARLDQRVKRLCAGAGIPSVELPYRRCGGALSDQIEEVLRYCQSEGILMVVVDSVEMAMGGGGEDRDPNERVKRLHEALRLLRTTALLVDHVNKEQLKQKGKRDPYGGVYKVNLARMVYELRSVGEPGRDLLRLALNNTKRNDDGPKLPSVGLTLSFADGAARYEGGKVEGEELGGNLKNEERIALVLQKEPLFTSAIAASTGISEAVVRTTCNKHKNRFCRVGTGEDRYEKWGLLETRREAEPEIDF